MTAAAFKASYSDWKLVKTRGVVQVIFEIPLAECDLAYQVIGGMPDSAQERWFGIARLDPDKATTRARVPPDKRLAQQAGIACADPVFQRFLLERELTAEQSEESAVHAVYAYCGITSRSQIILGSEAAANWDHLYGNFVAWRAA